MPEPEPEPRCPAAPTGESHRWRLPSAGLELPATCNHCGAAKTFTPFADEATAWGTAGERIAHQPASFLHLVHRRGEAGE